MWRLLKGNACRLLSSARPSVRPSVQRRRVRPSQKAPGEQREQLVSLVWLKEKQRSNHFMTPARPIKDAGGLRGAGGARRGEAKWLRWEPGCTAPGAADCLCREDLHLTIPGAVMMESGG